MTARSLLNNPGCSGDSPEAEVDHFYRLRDHLPLFLDSGALGLLREVPVEIHLRLDNTDPTPPSGLGLNAVEKSPG